jgi:hypothetical protein
LSGTIHPYQGEVTVNGGAGAAFNNNGGSTIELSGATISSDVIGVGSFDLGAGIIEFVKSVGAGQSITAGAGAVRVDQPNAFAATMTLMNIWSGNQVIDTLRLNDQTQYGFDVVKTPGSVNVVVLTSSGETLPGALPIHMGS